MGGKGVREAGGRVEGVREEVGVSRSRLAWVGGEEGVGGGWGEDGRGLICVSSSAVH